MTAAAARTRLASEGMENYFYILERYILPLLVVLTIVLFFGYAASRLLKRRNRGRRPPLTEPDNIDKEEGTATFLKELTSTPPIRDPASEHEPHMDMKKTDTPLGRKTEPSLSATPGASESPRQATPASEAVAPAAAAVLARIAKIKKAAEAEREELSETKNTPAGDTGRQSGLGSEFEALFANMESDDGDNAPEASVLDDDVSAAPEALVLGDEVGGSLEPLLLEDAVMDEPREPGNVDPSGLAPAPAGVPARTGVAEPAIIGEPTGKAKIAGPVRESDRLDDIIRDLASLGTPADMPEAMEADAPMDEDEPPLLLNDPAADNDGAALPVEAEPGDVSAPPAAAADVAPAQVAGMGENQATRDGSEEESLIAQIASWAAERSETATESDGMSPGLAPAATDDTADEPLVLTEAVADTQPRSAAHAEDSAAAEAMVLTEASTSSEPEPLGAPPPAAFSEDDASAEPMFIAGAAIDGASAGRAGPGDLTWDDLPGIVVPAGEHSEDQPFDSAQTANMPVQDAPPRGGDTAQEASEENLVVNDLIAAGLLRTSTSARETDPGNVAPLMPQDETRPRNRRSAPEPSESEPPLIADRARWWPDARPGPQTETADAVAEQLDPPREEMARGVEVAHESVGQIAAQFDYVTTVLRQSMASLSENIKATKGLCLDEVRAMQISGVDGLRDASARLDVLGADVVSEVGEGEAILAKFNRIVDRLAEMAATEDLDEGWNDLVRQRISDTMYAVDRVSKRLHHVLPPEHGSVDGAEDREAAPGPGRTYPYGRA